MYKDSKILLIFLFLLTCSIGHAQDTLVNTSATPEDAVILEEGDSPEANLFVEEESSLEADLFVEEIDDGLISVNFQNTSVSDVLKVLGDITGKIVITHDGLSGSIQIDNLERAEPDVVINIIKSSILAKGYTVVESDTVLKIVPIPITPQTNIAVRIGSSPEDIADEDVVVTQAMPLKYASALKLKTILQPLIGAHGNLIAHERSNTLIITDVSSNIRRIATIIAQMETELPSDYQVKTFTLNYGNAETIAEIIGNISNDDNAIPYPVPESAIVDGENLEIFGSINAYADKETNSIVVTSAPINFPTIKQLIEDLDVFPPQAMIELIIMDVTLDDDFTMGVEFSDATTPTLTTSGYKTDISGGDFRESIFHSLLGLATDSSTAGFTYRVLNNKETVQALAFILKTQENSKVLSTPKILASNNKESSITVAQEIPILESSVTDLSNNVTNTDIRYQDVGLILKVTPRISRDGFVNLDVHAELSDVSAQTLLNASIINKREATASVILPDRHTVVMGGLMRDNNSLVESKIPFLGDIPIIGVFFKKTSTALLKSELLIFITPHIIKTTDDLIALSSRPNEKMNVIKSVEESGGLKKAIKKVTDFEQNRSEEPEILEKKKPLSE